MSGVMKVSEYRGRWLRGRLSVDSEVVIEISFEGADNVDFCIARTPISYMGAWRNRQVLFEFQLGMLCVKPDDMTLDALRPVVERLIDYRPVTFASS